MSGFRLPMPVDIACLEATRLTPIVWPPALAEWLSYPSAQLQD
ncbi:MAG: hypothetical protein ACQEXO_06800 [Pseudomonadota bacterium]